MDGERDLRLQGGVAKRRGCEWLNPRLAERPRPLFENRDRDSKVSTKSEPETLYEENRARDFIMRNSEQASKTYCSET